MTPLHAVVLGLVQGATEFLPISSSGHLILVPALLGWPDQGLAFDAAVHLGTALALLCYFAPELWRLGTGLLVGRPGDRRLIVALAVGTVPAALAGVALEHVVETRLRATAVVAVATVVGGVILWGADRRAAGGRIRELRQVGVARAFGIGLAQILALIPGTSRSGITLSAGLFLALDRPTAARFAFLLGLPITAGAGLLKTAALARGGPGAEAWNVALAIGTSFAAGLAAIWFLIAYLRRRTLLAFVVYRLLLGALLLAMVVG